MIAKFDEKIASHGAADKISTVCKELKGESDELDGQKFDVVIVSVHHMSSI